MTTHEVKASESVDFAIAGCPREVSVVGSVMRAGLQALNLQREVYKVRLTELDEVARLVSSLRRRRLAAFTMSGRLGHEAVGMVDVVDPSAAAVNCADSFVVKDSGVVAYNTNYLAFRNLLKASNAKNVAAIVVGSGARACAAVAACRDFAFQIVAVTSRSWTSTEALHESEAADRIRRLGALPTLWPRQAELTTTNFSREMRMQFSEIAASANVLIQTVAVDPLSSDAYSMNEMIPWPKTRRDALVCDLVYGAVPGPFLAGAEREVLARVGGIEMLTRRAAILMEIFTGLRPPPAALHVAAVRVCMGSGA